MQNITSDCIWTKICEGEIEAAVEAGRLAHQGRRYVLEAVRGQAEVVLHPPTLYHSDKVQRPPKNLPIDKLFSN